MRQYEACFLTKFPDRCGVIKWTNFRYRAECETKKRALSQKGERAEEEVHHCRRVGGNDLHMTVVYCALAGSAG